MMIDDFAQKQQNSFIHLLSKRLQPINDFVFYSLGRTKQVFGASLLIFGGYFQIGVSFSGKHAIHLL